MEGEEEKIIIKQITLKYNEEAGRWSAPTSSWRHSIKSYFYWNQRRPEIFGPAIDQGKGGCCWAVATTELISATRLINWPNEPFVLFSAQDLIDGCYDQQKKLDEHGGYPHNIRKALDWVAKNGILRADELPFQGGVTVYNQSRDPEHLFYIRGYKKFDTIEELINVLDTYLVGAALSIYSEIFNYSNGIYRGPEDEKSEYVAEHAVTVVGIGIEDGEMFAWVRSSWGPAWGIDGHLKVSLEVMHVRIKEGRPVVPLRYLLTRFAVPTLFGNPDGRPD